MIVRSVCVLFFTSCVGNLLWAQDTENEREPFNPCQAAQLSGLFKPIADIRTQLERDDKRLPPDCSSAFFASQTVWNRNRSPKVYTWQPTDFFHMPLYFDDVPLERYGQSKHPLLQPVYSGARFLAQVPAIPYKMAIDCPHDCITTLGHRPAGTCAPCVKQKLPCDGQAALMQGAVAVGLVFFLP